MLIHFQAWHMDMMALAGPVKDILGQYPSREIIANLASVGLAFTIVADTGAEIAVLGVAGAVPISGGRIGEVFVVASEDRHEHLVTFSRSVKRVLQKARGRFSMIEAVTGPGTQDRWFEWLGFNRAAVENRWQLAGLL